MRNYQRKRNNPYLLPHDVYMQSIYAIKDYERLKNEYSKELHSFSSQAGDNQSNSRGIATSPTERKAIKLSEISTKIDYIESAFNKIPSEYKHGVMRNIMYGERYPIDADYRTYQTYKQRVIFYYAQISRLI